MVYQYRLGSVGWALTILPALSLASLSPRFGRVLPVDLPSMEDLRVKDLDKVVPAYGSFEGQMFAGSLPVDHTSTTGLTSTRTGTMQFWLFVPHQPSAPGTVVSWFNGGPGCSSMFGNTFENGPVTVPLHESGWCCEGASEALQPNEYAWTNATIMLYVEQPIGVGFSEATNGTPPPSSEDDVAADFEAFLQNFYTVFDSLVVHKLYLVGESYAGIYIPAIARGIHLRNKHQKTDRVRIPLAGIAIGNGKIDAISQDPASIDFCYWHGLIDGPTRNVLYEEWDACMKKTDLKDGEVGGANKKHMKIKQGDPPFHSFSVRGDCGIFGAALEAAGSGAFEPLSGGPNMYEYSTWDPYAAGDGEDGTVSMFFNNLQVQKALNLPGHRLGMQWNGCIPEVEDVDERRLKLSSKATSSSVTNNHHHRRLFMDFDTPWSVTAYIAELLDDAKIDVLMYSGDRDIICCTQGTEDALQNMDWTGTREPVEGFKGASHAHNAWTHAPRSLWIYNESYPAGYIKTYKNLQLLTVYNAGHMVPYNQPGPALDMLERFLRQESFHDRPLADFVSKAHSTSGEKVQNLLETSIVGESSQFTSSSALSGTVMLTVAMAFVLGFVIARITGGKVHQQRRDGFGHAAQYGSIST